MEGEDLYTTDCAEEEESLSLKNVKKFIEDGCGCSKGPKDGPCSLQFTEEEIMTNLNNCLELSAKELNHVILANIQAVTRASNVGEKRSRSPRCSLSRSAVKHFSLCMV